MIFQPCDSQLFFSRRDRTDPRLGALTESLGASQDAVEFRANLERRLPSVESEDTGGELSRHFVIAGYPDDEGIRLNGGRPGAAEAPDRIRQSFYKMTPPLLDPTDFFFLWDAGNLQTQSMTLADRHREASAFAKVALDCGAVWVGLGGGHDYGFADAAAFLEWCREAHSGERPLVINFDAHLDVRPAENGLSSGTPFYRMLEAFPDVDFVEVGIQTHCNSRSHLQWARERGVRILTQDEVLLSGESFTTMTTRLLDDWLLKRRPAFLSVDIDGFSSSVAPGCSQSWATGVTAHEFMPLLEILNRRLDLKILGIYEVSPPLDQDDRTAKLAAQILHRILGG